MKTAIAILNWNGIEMLKIFLPKLILYSKNADIYIIDNRSTDNSIKYLKTHFKRVKIIQNKKNYGFSKGYNIALKDITCDLLVLVNSDIEVTPNWLTPIITAFENDKNLCIAQPKVLDYHHKSRFEYAGAGGGFIDKLGYPYCRGRIFGTLEEDHGQYNDTIDIFWATGACFFIRKNDFDTLGGFDERFFAHQEEIDLCWRAQNCSKKVKYIGISTIYHIGGASLCKHSSQKTFLNFRNSLFSILKNAPKSKVLFIIIARLLLDGVAGITFILQGKVKHCIAIIRAHFSFYRYSLEMIQQRNNQNLKKYYDSNSIVYEYFIRGKKKYKDL